MATYPFTARIRKSTIEGGSYEVTVNRYLIKQGFLKEGREYQFTVVVPNSPLKRVSEVVNGK